MYTVAEQLVDILERAGVRRLYGIVGDSLNPITDAIHHKKTIEWIHVRHEEVAAFAASAEAQMTGSLAVCCGSAGPGNLHLINGLFDAHRTRVPVLAIASHIPQSEIGTNYFQATHPEMLFRECSCYDELISDPSQVARVMQTAIQHAISLNDVAVVVIPGDVAGMKAEKLHWMHPPVVLQAKQSPNEEAIQCGAKILNEAKKVTLFCGAGCAGYEKQVIDLAKRLNSPVAYTWRGKEYFEHDNPFSMGMTGLLGWGGAYEAMFDSDLIVMLGTDFPYTAFIPDHLPVIQVDARGEMLGRRGRLDLGINGDVSMVIEHLMPLVEEKTDASFLKVCQERHRHQLKRLNAYIAGQGDDYPLRPEQLTDAINRYANQDALFTIDTGTPCLWAARYLSGTGQRKFIASFHHGTMANAMPMAIGLLCTDPKRQVVSLCGDGGLSMLLGDLITIVQYKLPVKLVVYDNDALDFIIMEMQSAGMEPWQVDLHNPSYASLADSIGIKGFRLTKASQVDSVVQEFLAHPGPALLDAVVNAEAIALPPAISLAQVTGFGKSMIKEALHGDLKHVVRTLLGNRKILL